MHSKPAESGGFPQLSRGRASFLHITNSCRLVDGVHFNIRLKDERFCTPIMIGAKPNGEKELLTVEDGYRESAEGWKTGLRELKQRGMVPVLPVPARGAGRGMVAADGWKEGAHRPPPSSVLLAVVCDAEQLPRRVRGAFH